MNQLPPGWVLTNLECIAKWGAGGTPSRKHKEYYDGDIPWVKTGDLGVRYLTQVAEFITQEGLDNSSAKVFPKGAVAIAMYGATIGKTSIFAIDAATNQACAAAMPDYGIDRQFLYFLLNNEKDNFISKGKGGAQPNISQAIIKAHEVALPPEHEQVRIANKLDSLLAKVETAQSRLEKIPTLLKRFRQSVLAAATSGELISATPNESVFVSDICQVIGGLTKNSKRTTYELKLPYLRVANVYENEFRLGDVAEIGVLEKELDRVLLMDDDLLVVEGNGSLDQVGRVALWGGQVRPCVHQNHLIKVRANTERVHPEYLLYYLMSPAGKEEIVSKATSGAGLYTLSLSKVRSIKVDLFSLEEQVEIVRRVESLFAKADVVETQYQAAKNRLDKLTQSTLAKAFRGELVPQNPNDEPASELLKRIQAEREKQATASKPKRAKRAKQ